MKYLNSLFLVLFVGFFFACDSDDETSNAVAVTFEVEHKVGSESLAFDEILFVNEAANSYSVETLKYFLSDITLHEEDGSTVLLKDVQYVDARELSTLSFAGMTQLAKGTYTKISLVFGLNESRNVSGDFPNTPENAMEWPEPMGGGYHYMKLEGKYEVDGETFNYNTHTGATMGVPYHVEIDIEDFRLKTDGDDVTITLTMDLNKWYSTPNVYNFETFGQAIMGNPTAQETLSQNGYNVFTADSE